jgi:hypothetical protein
MRRDNRHRLSGPVRPPRSTDPEPTDSAPDDREPRRSAEGLHEDDEEDEQAWNAHHEGRDPPFDTQPEGAEALDHRTDLRGFGATKGERVLCTGPDRATADRATADDGRESGGASRRWGRTQRWVRA